MLTKKEGFNIPLMHSCVNWTATNPLCTKSREMNPTVHQFSVSRKKTQQKKLKDTHRWLAHIKQRDPLPYQSAEKNNVRQFFTNRRMKQTVQIPQFRPNPEERTFHQIRTNPGEE